MRSRYVASARHFAPVRADLEDCLLTAGVFSRDAPLSGDGLLFKLLRIFRHGLVLAVAIAQLGIAFAKCNVCYLTFFIPWVFGPHVCLKRFLGTRFRGLPSIPLL